MKGLLAALVASLSLLLAPAAHSAFGTSDQVVTMDDGVGIATTLYTPVGLGPAKPPGVMMFHGIGHTRQVYAPIARRFAEAGYVVLTSDFRGHGQSGGLFGGLGPRELADAAALRAWLDASGTTNGIVGAWGDSLGGGAALRIAGEQRRFSAIEVVETWTDLYEALVPQDLPKSGAIFGFLNGVPRERQAPELLSLQDAIARRDVPTLRTFARARSSRELLASGYPPTLFFQGRQDFVFGLEQGIAGYRRLNGTRKLYIGPFGHGPSRFPGPDLETMLQRSVEWFDRYLKGVPNGVESRPTVELVPETGGTPVGFASIPPTRTHAFTLGGRSAIGSAGKVVRRTGTLPRLETFGAPVVRLRAASTTGWSHLVAVLVARTRTGQSIVVSEGGTPTSLGRTPRTVTIRLISQVKHVPAGSRFELTLAGTSTAQHPANLLYLVPAPQRARITIRDVRLTVPVLRSPVTR